jgi:hypothetical protein
MRFDGSGAVCGRMVGAMVAGRAAAGDWTLDEKVATTRKNETSITRLWEYRESEEDIGESLH